jgi:hypothetical protein
MVLTDAVCDYLDENQVSEFLTDLKRILEHEEAKFLEQLNTFRGVKSALFDSLEFTENDFDET